MKKIENASYFANVNTDNAAFQDGNSKAELARIQGVISARLAAGHLGGNVLDSNGTTVCEWVAKPRARAVVAAQKELSACATRVAGRALIDLPISIMLLGKISNAARQALLDGLSYAEAIERVREYAISIGAGKVA